MWMIGLYLFLGFSISDAGSHALLIGMEGSQSMSALETPMHHENHDSSFGDNLHEHVSLVDLTDPTIYPPPFFRRPAIIDAQLSTSDIVHSGEEGIDFSGSAGDEVSSSRTTPLSSIYSYPVGIHEYRHPETDQRVPGKPTNVTVETPSDALTTLSISWTPQPNGNKAITGIQLDESSTGDDNSWTAVFSRNINDGPIPTNYRRTGLAGGTTRYYRVSHRDEDGWGDWSDVVSGTVPTKSGPPTSVTTTVTATTISLSWSPPADDGGSPITGYDIEGYVQGDADLTAVIDAFTEPDVTSYTATGLEVSTEYQIVIYAVNSVGLTGYILRTTTTAATAPDPPTDLTATASGQTTINLEWTAPIETGGMPITGYEIQEFNSIWIQLVGSHDGTTYARTGLPAGATRRYRIRASSARGSSGWTTSSSVTTAPATAPGAPTGLTATASGRTTINLSWTAPTEG